VRKLVIGSFKGGVGKTTVAVNLAVALARVRGRKVLLIDTDPSANISAHFNLKPELSLYHVLMDGFPPEEVIVPLEAYGELYLLPSSRATQAAEFQIATEIGREKVLENRLDGLSGFDYVLVDTAPSISVIAQNAFVYAREILIPISMDPMSLLGAYSSVTLANDIRDKLRVDYAVAGIVPTFFDSRLVITRAVMEAIEERYPGIPVLPAIRSDAAVRKSTASGIPIVEFDRASRAAEDFLKLAEAIEEQNLNERRAANQ